MYNAFVAAAFGLAMMFLAGCSEAPSPLPLSVGVSPWIGNDPFVFAYERRYIDRNRIKVVELASNSQALRTLDNGLLDAAALTLDEALRLADKGAAIRIVAVLGISHGADAVVARAPITKPAQLKGKRIGIEDSAAGRLVLARMIERSPLRSGDVLLLRLEASQQEDALRDGWVDAVITYEPMKSRLQGDGYQVIFDSSAMSGELIDVLVVRADVLERRLDDVVALLAGWQRGVTALHTTPDAFADFLAPSTSLTPAQYRAALDGLTLVPLRQSVELLAGQPARFAARHAALAELLVDLEMIDGLPDWQALIDDRPARAAVKRTESGSWSGQR
ncbi:ABC transporter substrate-binding protein [Aromatoleum aromaticum]|uniref:Similar to ABC transporter n=1 Tax=Aromatoleum aromaticum (strain DSM 19018 / LMG 30748 / EbN1) TaxID=76114 RepID=Q5P4F6_AROAE|nr:ABC transporter substrate-binding protein [Aromatoleum aromaticum]NMG53581.1 hypothetical protein [Aromatoleum aromaticum]CAI07807.1 similar to ABC transporter [Aromatoleum aromaticum EbN1]